MPKVIILLASYWEYVSNDTSFVKIRCSVKKSFQKQDFVQLSKIKNFVSLFVVLYESLFCFWILGSLYVYYDVWGRTFVLRLLKKLAFKFFQSWFHGFFLNFKLYIPWDRELLINTFCQKNPFGRYWAIKRGTRFSAAWKAFYAYLYGRKLWNINLMTKNSY